LTGTNTAAEVLVASSHADTLAGGTGAGDTVDYSGSNAGVTVNLATHSATGGWATGDSITGFENVTGSSFADNLTAVSTGSVLDGGANSTGGTDTLTGGVGNDVLIASRQGADSLTGGGGNDTFVLQGNGAANVTITDFATGTDNFVVDVADKNLTITTAALINAATQFGTGTVAPTTSGTGWSESTSVDKFYFDSAHGDLWFSAAGTGADQVKLAHLSTGVVAAANVHIA
jgi:Ca2+-binding RTX toxin-like protein